MSGCATRRASPRPFLSETDGEQAAQQNRAGGGAGDPRAARDGRPHEVVHQHQRTAIETETATGETGRVNVVPAGDNDHVIEDHVPDNDGPRDPQRPRKANRGPRLHASIIARRSAEAWPSTHNERSAKASRSIG